MHTQRPQSSSFLGLPYRILYMTPKKELLSGLWVDTFYSNLAQTQTPPKHSTPSTVRHPYIPLLELYTKTGALMESLWPLIVGIWGYIRGQLGVQVTLIPHPSLNPIKPTFKGYRAYYYEFFL